MDAAAGRPEFAPPPERTLGRGFVFAVVAHLLLAVGLTQAVKWQRVSQDSAVEAELWSAVPQQAAPREVVAPPPPPPAPVVRAPPVPEPPVQRQADIALEQEKQKRLAEQLERDKQKRLAEQQERERQKRIAEQLEREEERRLEAAKRKREDELAKKKEQAKLLAEAKGKEEDRKRREAEEREAREARRVAQLREENMRRMQGMAGTGAPSSTGTAAQSSGPSASWGGRVQARVRPNIVFTEHVDGNPKAEVEVRSAPDGTIVSRRLIRSSGVKAWDDAVLRALDKTETLPRDVDGRVPSPVIIDFRPKG